MSKKWQSKQREFLKAHPKQLRRDYSREKVRVLNITEPPKNATDIAPIAKSSLTSANNSGNIVTQGKFYTRKNADRNTIKNIVEVGKKAEKPIFSFDRKDNHFLFMLKEYKRRTTSMML